MITDRSYNYLAAQVYEVDKNKNSTPWREGDKLKKYSQKFQVLAAEDNHKNGMQAMAVAPLDKNGKPDLSHIVVAYAGTNRSDLKDIQTDIQSIGLGEKRILADSSTKTIRTSQFQTSLAFAKEVEKHYPQAKISTTGHSLGESLAMYVALKRGYSNIGFNGPDIHNLISKEEIAYMQQHPEQFRNYRHKYDMIGNITGDETKTAIYPKIYQGKDELSKKLEYHQLSQWKFNEKGQLVDLNGKVITDATITAYAETVAGMYRYQAMKKILSDSGFSTNERIYLDSVQGMAVGEGLVNAARAGADEMTRYRNEAVEKSKELWNQIDFGSFSYLSHDEVLAIFAEAGVTYDSIVGDTERTFDEAKVKADSLAEDFEEMKRGIYKVIDSKLALDKKLAGDFKKWTNLM